MYMDIRVEAWVGIRVKQSDFVEHGYDLILGWSLGVPEEARFALVRSKWWIPDYKIYAH